MASLGERIVVLIDMDCFYCQVETRLQPEHKGKPLAVVQYNLWRMGGIIAVNYEARDQGVNRHMRGDEAKEKCPDLVLVSVPALRGKSDTSRYRSAGREVIDVLKKHCSIVERASVDEAYLDITDIVEQKISKEHVSSREIIESLSNTFIVGYSEVGKNDEEQRSSGMEHWISKSFGELGDIQAQRLAMAGVLVEQMRADIFEKTGFRCSAGISYNKILAKLACGLHKPNRQTILPAAGVPSLFATLPVKKVRNLGGKFGDVVVESLGCNVMADLLPYSVQDLQARFDEKTGLWLYNIARGVDNEPVTSRLVSKSIGACKKFPGKQAISTLDVLKHWVGELTAEVCERLEQDLEENERRATLLTVSFQFYQDKKAVNQSRSCPLTSYKVEKIAKQCVDIITKSTKHAVAFIGLSAGKFVQARGSNSFVNFFRTNHEDTSSTQCIDQTQFPSTSDEMEINATTSEAEISDATLEYKKVENNSMAINAMSDRDNHKSICADEDEFVTNYTEPILHKEVGGNLEKNTKKSEGENALSSDKKSVHVKIAHASDLSKVPKQCTLFHTQKMRPHRQSKQDDGNCTPISGKNHNKNETEIDATITSNEHETSNVSSVLPLPNGDKSLHADKFKKSFFMNMFKKSSDSHDESTSFQNTVSSLDDKSLHVSSEESTEVQRVTLDCPMAKSNSEHTLNSPAASTLIIASNDLRCSEEKSYINPHKDTNVRSFFEKNESYEKCKENDDRSDDTEVSLESNKNRNDISSNNDICSKQSTSQENCETDICEKDAGYHKGIMKNSEKCSDSETSITNNQIVGMTNNIKRQSDIASLKVIKDQSTMVQLQEIFPDLNNIDRSIVDLLPPQLQREAHLLLKGQKENNEKNTENSVKLQKLKSVKSKPSSSKSAKNLGKINTFFKKSNGIDPDESGPCERCSQCNKLIPLKIYPEHLDFHVAQDLQRVINKPMLNHMSVSKRKESITDSDVELAARKRMKNVTPETDRKTKSIASFFS